MAIGAILGGIGSTVAGIMAAIAQQKAAAYNHKIDLMNYYARERERRDMMNLANNARRDQQLGSTDAFGNRTKFVPGRGWVVELAPGQQQLLDAQQAEQRQVLSNDLPKRRSVLNANASRQREEDYVAGGLLDEFKRIQRPDTTQLANQLSTARSEGINEAYDGALETLSRRALRTGASNTGRVFEDINRQRADAQSDAYSSSFLEAPDIASGRFNNERQATGNLYNMFASRAQQMPDVSYAPQNIDGSSNSLMSMFAQRAGYGDSAAINAAGKQGGTRSFIEPNYGWANAVGGGATALGSGIDRIGAERKEKEQNELLMAFLNQGGAGNPATGGIFGRLLQNRGVI